MQKVIQNTNFVSHASSVQKLFKWENIELCGYKYLGDMNTNNYENWTILTELFEKIKGWRFVDLRSKNLKM